MSVQRGAQRRPSPARRLGHAVRQRLVGMGSPCSRGVSPAASAVVSMFMCALLIACGAAQKPRGRPAELRAVVEPPTAIVQIDEKFVGSARVLDKRPAQLTPGKHRVTVDAPGYFPHDVELNLARGVTTLELKLRAIPR